MEEISEKNSCPHCQMENPSDFKFCMECGTSLLEEVEPKLPEKVGKICPTCGAITNYDMKIDRWWCNDCERFIPEKEIESAPEPRSERYYPAPTKVEVKQRGSGGWIVVLIVLIVLGIIGLMLLRSGSFGGGAVTCVGGLILGSLPLLSLPIAIRNWLLKGE